MNNRNNNFVDITGDLSNHTKWNGVLLFWGLEACKCRTGGEYQPFNWYPPQSCGWGDNNYKIGSFELKVIIAVVLRSSSNSLASNEGGYLKKFYSLFGSQKQLVWAVVYCYPSLFVKLKPREETFMSIQNKKSNQVLPIKTTTAKSITTKAITVVLATGFVLSASFAISSRQETPPDRTTARGRGQYEASFIKHEVHAAYLNCYPLAPVEKKICAERVADKYLQEQYQREYESYLLSFQHESEKLGFKYFLKSKKLSCETLKHSPIFDNKEQAYIVCCGNNKRYYMRFDYDNRVWNLKEGK